MPPQSTSPSLELQFQPQPFFLTQLKPSEPLPVHIIKYLITGSTDGLASTSVPFLSVTRTKDEISVVSDFQLECGTAGSSPVTEWRCFRVAGPLDLGLTGIMNDITTPLKSAGIPVFAVSTFDTDYVLIPLEKGGEAVDVMRGDGWGVREISS